MTINSNNRNAEIMMKILSKRKISRFSQKKAVKIKWHTKFHAPIGPERRFFEIRPYKSMKDSEILAFLQEAESQLEPTYSQNIYG